MKFLYYGGTILTMEPGQEQAEAVLTEGNEILAVGTFQQLRDQMQSGDRSVALHGNTLLPAFIDSHSHILQLAQNQAKADLSQAASFDEIVSILKKFLKQQTLPKGTFLQGYGYDPDNLREGDHPTRFVLDEVTREHPIFISHVSSHMGVCNSLALEQTGVLADISASEAYVRRFPGSNTPDGLLREMGMLPVYTSIAALPQNWPQLLQRAQAIYLAHGILTVQEGAGSPETFELLKSCASSGDLVLDTNVYLMANENASLCHEKNHDWTERYIDHLRLAGYKLVLDGSPQGKTAWLTEPYTDGTNGTAWLSDQTVEKAARLSITDRAQLLAHCNGDAAADQFLRCWERAVSQLGETQLVPRPVMVHCQAIRRDQIEKMKALSMMATVFVDHVYRWGDTHLANLGQTRAKNLSPLGWMRAFGVPYTLHQDTPILPPNMLRSIQTAITRTTSSGILLGPEHRISVQDALRSVTIEAAKQYGEASIKGSIAPGKRAEFVLLSGNPLETAPARISELQVLKTIRGEEILFDKADRS